MASVPQAVSVYRLLHDDLLRCGIIDVGGAPAGYPRHSRKLTQPLACLSVATRYDFFPQDLTRSTAYSWSKKELEARLAWIAKSPARGMSARSPDTVGSCVDRPPAPRNHPLA